MFKNDVQMPIGFDWGKKGVFSLYGVLVGFLLMLLCPNPTLAQAGYTISQPAWANAPATTGGTNVTFTSQNDAVATVITIPFYFRFYGNNYNTLFINTNGWVAFTAQVVSSANTNANPAALPNAGTTIPKNCIMGPWQDWNNTGGAGIVRYRTDGTPPNRRFVVTYSAWPMSGCLTTNGTFQIVLNECTNIIEIYIYQKPACTATNGNRAVLGMQNLAGSVAHVVPGRNNTPWSVLNTAPELHRFTPDNPVINGTATVCVGATTQLTPSITGGTWTSATPAIATVSATGLVTGVSPGQSVITYNVAQAGAAACQRVSRTVTVSRRPTISVQPPTNISGAAGQPLAIPLTASGADSSRWQLDAGSGTGWVDVLAGSIYTGFNTTTLSISSLNPNMTGFRFRCILQNNCGRDTSTVCTLTVTGLSGPGLYLDTTRACLGGPADTVVVVPIRVANFTGIGAVSLNIIYNQAALTYLGFQNPQLSPNLIVNSPFPGRVIISWYSLVPSNIGAGNIIELRFSASSSSTLNFDVAGGSCEIADSTGAVLTTAFFNGSVSTVVRDTVTTVVASCDQYTWPVNGQVYTTAGSYQEQTGCRRNILNLSINQSSRDTTVVSACGQYQWPANGQTYSTSGNYTYTTLNAVGCDSIKVLNLTITPPPTAGTLSGNGVVCIGSSVNFSSTVSGGAWSSSDTNVAVVNAQTGAVSGISAGNAVMTYTVPGNGPCSSATATRPITVNARPIPGVISGLGVLCLGTSANYTSTVSGGVWSSSNPAVATVNTLGLVSGVSIGTADIRYTVSGVVGCPDSTAVRSVTVTSVVSAGVLSGNTNVCQGGTAQLVSTVTGGVWRSTNPAVASVNVNTGLVTGLTVGSTDIFYTIIGTPGCPSDSVSTTVVVFPAPNAGSISGSQNLCVGSLVNYSSTAPGGIWSSSNILIANIDPATGLLTAVSPGTVTITYTVPGSNGCPNATATRQVTITTVLTAGQLFGAQSVCVGSSTNFVSTVPGGTWSSGSPAVATVNPGTGLVTGVSAGISIITYTILGSAGCPSANATRVVSVAARPSPGVLSGSQTICLGATAQFSSTVSGGSWSSSNPAVATVNAAGLVTAVSLGTVNIRYTVLGTAPCPDSTAIIAVTVSTGISAGVITGSLNLCTGFSSVFSSTVAGGSWSSYNPAVASVNGAGLVTAVSGGSTVISYRVAGSAGCPDAVENRTVTVTTRPNPGVLSGSQSICLGTSIPFSSSISGGTWSSSNPSVATVNGAGLVTGLTPGNVQIVYTVSGSGACPDSSVSIQVTVATTLTAGVLSGSQSICVDGSALFASTVQGGRWSSGNTGVAVVDSVTGVLTGVSPGSTTITYTVYGLGGCPDASQTRNVTVTAPPIPGVLSGPSALCSGAAAGFSSSVIGGTWSSTNPSVATVNSSSGVVNAVSAGLVVIRYTVAGSGGCPDSSASITLTVDQAPSAGVLSGVQSLCVGAVEVFSSTATGGSWSSSNPAVAVVNVASGQVTALTPGTATITYTVPGTGVCPNATQTRSITVSAPPVAGSISGAQSVCMGSTAGYSVSSTGGVWSSSNTSIATVNASTGVLSPISAGTVVIKYRIQGSGGCPSDSALQTVTIIDTSATALNATICAPASYSFNGQTLTTTGIYTLRTPNAAGCDSVVTLNLVVNEPSQASQTRTGCDSLFWNGQIYRTSGNYSFTTTNAVGCDSTITLSLTLGYTRDTAVSLQACDSFVWNGQVYRQSGNYSAVLSGAVGCDSTVRLALSMGKTDSLIQQSFVCDSIYWPISGTWIKQSGTYVIRRSFATRCDSVYRLNLAVDQTPPGVSGFDSVICWSPGYELWYLDRNRSDLVWYEPGKPGNVLSRGPLFSIKNNFDVLEFDVSASSAGGCYSPPTRVRVRNEIYDPFTPMPNAFSPDGNGTNDVWFVESKFSMELKVFDRWGRLIHQDSGLRVSWDGKNYEPGVYPYEIRQNNCVGQKVSTKGVINLIK